MIGKAQDQAGFTLIEVLVVVAIISILAAIALPAYNDFVRQGMIAEALNALSDGRNRLEQYFDDNPVHSYVGFANCPGNTAHFAISCVVSSATAYTISASGTGTMLGFGYSIDQSNAKVTTGVPSGWTTPSPNTCWARSKSGSC